MTPFGLMNKVIADETTHIKWAIGKGATADEAVQHWHELVESEQYQNDEYHVIKRPCPADMNPENIAGIYWLSIRRKDKRKIRKWTDLQAIKNQLFGKEAEAIEIFPAESRKIDYVNQYHLFGGIGYKVPIGFRSVICSSE